MKVQKKKWYQVALMPMKYLIFISFGAWPKDGETFALLIGLIFSLVVILTLIQ